MEGGYSYPRRTFADTDTGRGVTFRILGPLEAWSEQHPIGLGGERQQIVLALLVLEANRDVAVSRLVEAVWHTSPPATARNQIQAAISDLRRRFAPHTDHGLIVSRRHAYSLHVGEDGTDVQVFQRAVLAGREAIRRGDRISGVRHLRHALSLWRGDPAAGLSSPLVVAATLRLAEERLAVVEECLAAELDLGRHLEVVGEAREWAEANPLRAGFTAHLMVSLYRAGRQPEALAAYQRARQTLVQEYGLDPAPRLVALEAAILAGDPYLGPPDATYEAVVAHSLVPRQLPPDLPDFVGREAECQAIAKAVTAGLAHPEARLHPVVVSGPGGVGKTELAVHVADSIRSYFPGGQLFARLTTGEHEQVPSEDLLRDMLRGLGISGPGLPTGLTELSAMFRSCLSGRRVLVVLDDAVSAAQVLPLLPGDATSGVIVTSRGRLHGLPGAHRIDLRALTEDDSIELMSRVLGAGRVAAERTTAIRIAQMCGHLPLALRIAAAKLSVRPHWPLERMLTRLSDEQQRLDELVLEGIGVRASIAQSYRSLSRNARRLLLLLGTIEISTFPEWLAAPLLDVSVAQAADLLQVLVEAWLLDVSGGVGLSARYRMHDLVKAFVREAAETELPAADRDGAQRRVLRCWLHLACAAHRTWYGGDYTMVHSAAEHWRLPESDTEQIVRDPVAWFEPEQHNLTMAVRLAARLGETEVCWDLAGTLVTMFEAGAHVNSWRRTHAIALKAARAGDSRRGEAAITYGLGALALFEDRLNDAREYFDAALTGFEHVGDGHGRGLALRNLAFVDRLQGRYRSAEKRYRQALELLRSAGDPAAEAHSLIGMAQIELSRGDHDHTERLLTEALAISESIGVRRIEAQAHNRLGQLRLAQGDLVGAEAEFTQTLRAATEMRDPVGRAYALLGLGTTCVACGDHHRARQIYQQALELTENVGDQLCRARVLLAQAELAVETGDDARAETRLDLAEQTLADIGARAWLTTADTLRRRLRGRA